jgi:DeoR/GlpR family transcriptional regulator of sugar metabolism
LNTASNNVILDRLALHERVQISELAPGVGVSVMAVHRGLHALHQIVMAS